MTNAKNLNVGIVGYGFATATFHAPLILATPGLTLSCIASSNAARVQQALPGMDVADSPAALFAMSDIDLVVIATPNATHYPLAVAALEAGKHVIDKPFTLDVAQARQLISCAANLALQGGVKSADGKAVLAFNFSAEFAAVRCTVE